VISRISIFAVGAALSLSAAVAQTPPAPEAAAGAASILRQMSVDALEDMDLVAPDGREVGEIEGVVEGQDGKRFVIVERGGVLGIGAKEIAIPLENVVLQGDRLTLRAMDMAALDAMPAFRNENGAFRELDDDQQIGLPQP